MLDAVWRPFCGAPARGPSEDSEEIKVIIANIVELQKRFDNSSLSAAQILEHLKHYEERLNDLMQQGLECSLPLLLESQEVTDAKEDILKARKHIEALRSQCGQSMRR